MGRHRKAALLAFATALAGVLLSVFEFVRDLEATLGLGWSFHVRDLVKRPQPPANVVIVNADGSGSLALPAAVTEWRREIHAQLVDRLVAAGASAIAFDITFIEEGPSPNDNKIFADAISRAGRIVLAQRQETLVSLVAGGISIAPLQNPKPVLAKVAQGLAPALLPHTRANWSWTFTGPTDADVPTLPAVLVQVHALPSLPRFAGVLEAAGVFEPGTLPRRREEVQTAADLLRFMNRVRTALRDDRRARAALVATASEISSPDGETIRALVAMYTGGDASYLNFYGPAATICTTSYDALLGAGQAPGCPLRGALVLVGGATDVVQTVGEVDTHFTPYDQPDGVRLSGVEILATATANLLTRTSLRPLGDAHAGLLALFGGVMGAGVYYVRTRRRLRPGAITARIQAAAVVLALAAAYVVAAAVAFQTMYVVWPLVVPLAMQLPLALILGLLVRPAEYEEQVEAICLATDAAGSTAIGQRLSHGRYARLMNEYNEALRAPVIARGGATLEPQGDGFVCLWCAPGKAIDAAMRQQACAAALEIADASQRFNRSQPEGEQLPTRVGLNIGMVTVYSDADRGIFKAFGDTVNVAARLRDLNVELGTRVLACDRLVDGLGHDFVVRHLPGTHSLKGVASPTAVFEVAHVVASADLSRAPSA